MSDDVTTIAASLVASFLFALAAALQQRAASTIPDEQRSSGRLLKALVHEPIWWAGNAADVAGYAAHAAALGIGSLLLVQPVLMTSLLFALPLGWWLTGRRLYPSDWAWAAALSLALGVFIDVGEPTVGVATAPLRTWLPVLLLIGLGSAAAVVVAGRRTGRVRAGLLAVATGAVFGLSSALTKSVMAVFDHPLGDALRELFTPWETAALLAALIAGFVLQQAAFQAGNLKESLPATLVVAPVAAVAIGVGVLSERLEVHDVVGWVVIAATLVVMLVATVQLSRSSVIHDPAGAAPESS